MAASSLYEATASLVNAKLPPPSRSIFSRWQDGDVAARGLLPLEEGERKNIRAVGTENACRKGDGSPGTLRLHQRAQPHVGCLDNRWVHGSFTLALVVGSTGILTIALVVWSTARIDG